MSFRCHVCDELKTQMWGDTCNKCRLEQERHAELTQVTRLTKERDSLLATNKILEASRDAADTRVDELRIVLEGIANSSSESPWILKGFARAALGKETT